VCPHGVVITPTRTSSSSQASIPQLNVTIGSLLFVFLRGGGNNDGAVQAHASPAAATEIDYIGGLPLFGLLLHGGGGGNKVTSAACCPVWLHGGSDNVTIGGSSGLCKDHIDTASCGMYT
jgi:hypothetical protein